MNRSVKVLLGWKFSPARKNGEPVEVLARIPVVFKDPGK
jgi:hypothetical protein